MGGRRRKLAVVRSRGLGYKTVTMKTLWKILTPDPETVEAIRRERGCDRITATVFANRNICTAVDLRNFSDCTLKRLRPPFAIQDIDKAADRMAAAILNRERIWIFGDYDADGVTATALLLDFLRYTGADVDYYIPHRANEGYDLQKDHILRRALPLGVDLIITVDCGSTRHEAVEAAKAGGIDVIITDHHTIPDPPAAAAVVNPKRADCGAGFEHLAGVGVAFFLVVALRKRLRDLGFWKHRREPNLKYYCDLVALGTIADMVPLTGENRVLASIGLELMNAGYRPGLDALMRVSGLQGVNEPDDIAFRLAPRINAAGRIDHARLAVELLTTRDPKQAETIARTLNRINIVRQETEQKILEGILRRIDKAPGRLEKKALVMDGHDWHEGVLGIVASKLVERFFRPVVLISTRRTLGIGSGRSIAGINLHAALSACDGYLDKFGGHPMAAGLRIYREKVEPFRDAFEGFIAEASTACDYRRVIEIDCDMALWEITDRLIDEIDGLNPFGEGNPEPVFMSRDVVVSESFVLKKKHRKMVLRPKERTDVKISAIQFNVGAGPFTDAFERIAFRLRWNRWNGRKTAQLLIEAAESSRESAKI